MTTNVHRGEKKFKHEDKEYTLCYNIDTICFIEERTGKGMMALFREFSDMEKASLSKARMIFFAGLQEHHPDLDEKKVGRMIPSAGGLMEIIKLIKDAFPEASEDEVRPPQGQSNGTGPVSSPSGLEKETQPKSSGS